MEYLITAYPSTPTPAMILTPPARAYSPSPSPSPAPEPEREDEPVASTSKLPSTSRRVLDHILLPRLPAGWLSAPPAARASEPVQDAKACHQCRNLKNPHPRFRCGRAGCLRAFCSGCLARRYGWTPQDVHARGCPDCRGVCNCSRCLDRAGLSKHKAFLTADARAGGCARKWLEERGLLVEGSAALQPLKKNVARRPKILAKKQPDDTRAVAPKKVKKTQPQQVDYNCVYDEEDDEPRSRGRWIIDASAKLVKRWARERAVRGAQVRAGTRRWFVGASPPPRARARDATAEPLLVETIDLTLDDDDEDAPDSLFDAKSADGDVQAPACGELNLDDGNAKGDDDAPDSLFDEKTEDEDALAQNDAADDKDDAPALNDAAQVAQNDAPGDKDDDKDSLFDGDPGTPAAPTPPEIAPAPIELPSTPPQLPPTPIQLPPTPTPIHLPPTPTPIHLPPTPTPVQLPPASPIISLSRSDSYTDALRIDVELGMPSSPAKGAVDVRITFGDAFGATSAAGAPVTIDRAHASPVAARSPVTSNLALGPAPASPVAARSSGSVDSTAYAARAPYAAARSPATAEAAPFAAPASRSPVPSTAAFAPTPADFAPTSADFAPAPALPVTDLALSAPARADPAPPPKTAVSKAASAMFIPRAKPVAKRKRPDDDETRLESAKTRLESAKSSAGVLVALGRPGRWRVREDEPTAGVGDALVQHGEATAQNDQDDALAQKDNKTPQRDDSDKATAQKNHALARTDDATNDKDDAPIQEDGPVAQQGGALLQKDDAAGKKRSREHDTSTQDDERPAKRPALSKETVRKPRADSPEREDDYDVDDEPRAAPSKETARKPRADAGHDLSSLDHDGLPVGRTAPSKQTARASSSRHEDSEIVDGLPTPKPTATKQDAARPSAADALAQAMRAAYGGGASVSTSNPTPAASSAPVASGSSTCADDSRATVKKRSKPSVLAQRASLAIALKTPAPSAPSAASALAAAYKQAYAAARAPSPASTLRSSPSPEPPEKDGDGKASKPALHDELSTFIGRFDDNDKDDEEPTPELLPSDLAAQSEGSSRTGPVSPLVAAHRRPPTLITLESDAEDGEEDEEMPARRPFVPCNPRRFVGMPLRFVPAPKRPRPSAKRVDRAVIDLGTGDDDDDDDYKDEDEQDFGLARRRKRTKLWEQSAVVLQADEPIVVLDDSDDSDFQPAPALVKKFAGSGKGKGKSKSFGPGKSKSFGPGPGKGKTKPPPRKLPLSTFIAYSYTPPPSIPAPDPDPEPELMPEPVFVPDDDTAAAPPASEVWLGAAMAPLSPDLGLTRAVADAWFSAV